MERQPLTIVYRALEALIPYARNARTHSAAQVAQIAASIREWGFTNPVLVDDEGGIIAGHGRILAARKLEMREVPTITLRGLSEAQKAAYVIADNQLALNAGWDLEMLSAELHRLQELSFDVALTGYPQGELDKLLRDWGGGAGGDVVDDDDDVPDLPADPITKPGDLWQLGPHRLLCGDATAAASWARVLHDGERLDLVFTDPPYGVDYVGKTDDALEIENDDAKGLPELLGAAFDAMVAACRAGAVWYVCAPPGPHMRVFIEALAARGLFRQTIVWSKDAFVLGHSDFHYQHEPIFYGWTPGAAHRPPPDRCQHTLWAFDRPRSSRVHPTMKPLPMVGHAIGLSSIRGDVVGDAFAGSGTTLLAAAQLGRTARAIELSPAYCDVVVDRWQHMTGDKATRTAG